MEESCASGGGRGSNKRFWTPGEDKALIIALCDMANDPHWKCENGFGNGYMIKLEELTGKAISGCGLKVVPHIGLKTVIGKYRAIMQILKTSGIKWDDGKHIIYVKRSVYDEYFKAHPNCRILYGYSFPYLQMASIYEKDYATRKSAQGFVEVVENMEKEVTAPLTLDSSDEDVDVDDSSVPPLKNVRREKSVKRGGRKSGEIAKGSPSFEFTKFENFVDNLNVHLSTMANTMKTAEARESEVHERGMEVAKMSDKVLDEIPALEGITPDEALAAAELLWAQPHQLTLFFKCSSALKNGYVKGILGESSSRGRN